MASPTEKAHLAPVVHTGRRGRFRHAQPGHSGRRGRRLNHRLRGRRDPRLPRLPGHPDHQPRRAADPSADHRSPGSRGRVPLGPPRADRADAVYPGQARFSAASSSHDPHPPDPWLTCAEAGSQRSGDLPRARHEVRRFSGYDIEEQPRRITHHHPGARALRNPVTDFAAARTRRPPSPGVPPHHARLSPVRLSRVYSDAWLARVDRPCGCAWSTRTTRRQPPRTSQASSPSSWSPRTTNDTSWSRTLAMSQHSSP